MHILETFFTTGFDYKMIRGGIDVYIWNLAKNFIKKDHKVSIVIPAHGQIEYLKTQYKVEKVDYQHTYRLPIALDMDVWKGFREVEEIPLTTTVYKLTKEGIDIYLLSNEYLDKYPDTFFPPYETKGKDLSFFKPMIYQIDFIFFVRQYFADEKLLIHAHEPYYLYLIPIAFKDDNRKKVISTVQSNMPVDKKIYKKKLENVLNFLGLQINFSQNKEKYEDSEFHRCMMEYMPVTHLYYKYNQEKYINFYSLILEYSDAIDFLSDGHRYFYTTFQDTAFQPLYHELEVSRYIQRNFYKTFVGWCAIGNPWFEEARTKASRESRMETLQRLGLNPEWPTFYHNARYAVEHKGQVELMKAIGRVLEKTQKVNFIIRMLSANGIKHDFFLELAAKYPKNLYLEYEVRQESDLISYVKASDFCIFPSKFEMDTFLIAQGEAMLNGLVPLATRQYGMIHWDHFIDMHKNEATGFSLIRSFSEDDVLLVDDLERKIFEAIAIYKNHQDKYHTLSENSRKTASKFSWDFSANSHLTVMQAVYNGITPEVSLDDKLYYQLYYLLEEKEKKDHYHPIEQHFFQLGDYLTYKKLYPSQSIDSNPWIEACYDLGNFSDALAAAQDAKNSDWLQILQKKIHTQFSQESLTIQYHYPKASRIRCFIKNNFLPQSQQDTSSIKRKEFTEYSMTEHTGTFTLETKTTTKPASLYFLLTLQNGREVWEEYSTLKPNTDKP